MQAPPQILLLSLLGALTCSACNGGTTGVTGSGTTGTGGGSSTGAGSGGATAEHTMPDAQFIPTPTGACPDFTSGKNTFSPAGIAPRDVLLWFSDAAGTTPGPLVFFWHGAGGDPSE